MEEVVGVIGEVGSGIAVSDVLMVVDGGRLNRLVILGTFFISDFDKIYDLGGCHNI